MKLLEALTITLPSCTNSIRVHTLVSGNLKAEILGKTTKITSIKSGKALAYVWSFNGAYELSLNKDKLSLADSLRQIKLVNHAIELHWLIDQ